MTFHSCVPRTVRTKAVCCDQGSSEDQTPGSVAKQQRAPPTAVNQEPSMRPNLRPRLSTMYTATRQKGTQRPYDIMGIRST